MFRGKFQHPADHLLQAFLISASQNAYRDVALSLLHGLAEHSYSVFRVIMIDDIVIRKT